MENRLLKELLELIKQRPDLPIIPMVDSEIVCDDSCSRWMGSWGSAEITKYIQSEERIFFYDESDMEDVLREIVGDDWYDGSTEEKDLEKYRSLPKTAPISTPLISCMAPGLRGAIPMAMKAAEQEADLLKRVYTRLSQLMEGTR